MISEDTHCTLLVDQIRDRAGYIIDGFKLYVNLFSDIIAGTVALRLQFKDDSDQFALLANVLVTLVATFTVVTIIDNIRSWTGLRDKLSDQAGLGPDKEPIIPPPNVYRSFRIEGIMLVIIGVTTIGFWIFNPLK